MSYINRSPDFQCDLQTFFFLFVQADFKNATYIPEKRIDSFLKEGKSRTILTCHSSYSDRNTLRSVRKKNTHFTNKSRQHTSLSLIIDQPLSVCVNLSKPLSLPESKVLPYLNISLPSSLWNSLAQ